MNFGILKKLARLNWIFLVIALVLCTISVAVIYSATYAGDNAEFRDAYKSQMLQWIPIGIVVYFIFALVDYQVWIKLAIPMFAIILVLLVAVLIFGKVVNGAKSWFGIGGLGIQPAEFSKICFILFLGLILAWRAEQIQNFSTFALTIVLTAVPMALILRQPDLGSAAVFMPIAFVMMFVAGVNIRYLMIPVFLGLMVMGIIVIYVLVLNEPLPGLKPYQMNRIKTFFDPSLDPLNAGWTINQSMIAIGSGGIFGKGWLQGTQNVLGFLPRNISFTDFIFSVVGEEWGFVGGSTVILLEGMLILYCVRIGMNSRDTTGSVLTAGVAAMLFTHTFVNIGMTIKVVPITGIPLPLISYGGSFLIVCFAALGLAQSVWIHRKLWERN